MKILITGANGMLAHAVKEEFKQEDLICTDVMDLDITDETATIEYVRKIMPDYIINCAAYTAVDKAEEDIELARKVNAIGPKNLAKAAKNTNCPLIHISTDYVFAGDKDINECYKEDEPVAPITVYGKTKAEGEKYIKENCEKYYIFRTAWLYGEGNNFVRTMLKLGKQKDELSVVADQHGSPTYTVDLAKIIYQAIEKQIPYGIYHTTNEEFTTWYDFTKKIFELSNIDCKVNPVTTEQYIEMMKITQAKRPKNSQLSKQKILKEKINVPNWQNALERYLKLEGEM